MSAASFPPATTFPHNPSRRLILGAGQGRDSGWPITQPREVTLPGARAIRKLLQIAQIAAGSGSEGDVGLGLAHRIPSAS